MRIWELTHCEMNYAVFTPEEKWSIDYIQSFNGSRKSENWIPLFLVLDQPESEHPLNDFPGFQYTSFIIFISTYKYISKQFHRNNDYNNIQYILNKCRYS